MAQRPFLILIVLDGFGCRKERQWNAIAEASTPRFDRLFRESSWTTLNAAGTAVGLPEGQMGNSEVGHLNLGAGFRVLQDLPRITKAIDDGSFDANPTLRSVCHHALDRGTRLHILGLIGPGGIHAVDRHLEALVDLAHKLGLPAD